jgi:hypothetical protein
MKPIECEFEADVLSAAVQSRWPDRVDAGLREHVRTCAICADVALVAGALEAAGEQMRPAIVVPDSGRVWWLAQLRARREAARDAGRPITAAQVIAFTCSIALLGACFGATSAWFQSGLKWLLAGISGVDAAAIIPLLVEHGTLAVAMLAIVLLIPAAVYLAVGRD